MTTLESIILPDVMKSGEFKGQPYPLKSLYMYCVNPVGGHVDENSFLEDVIDNLDFVCTSDIDMTSTARYSDLVLPAAHHYEVSDVVVVLATQPYLQYSQAAVAPSFESKADRDIARLIAERMGVGEYFEGTGEDYFRELLDSPFCRENGITFDRLRDEGAIRVVPDPWIACGGNQTFPAPDGRMQFYVESPQPRFDYGQEIPVEREQLPYFFPPAEAWPGSAAQRDYPLVLMSERPRYRVHSQWYGVPWLRELEPEPIVKVNPVDAGTRGISDGDYVELFNSRGHAVAKAVLTEGIKPGCLTYPKGWQRHQHLAGSFSELSTRVADPMGVNESFFDATVELRLWEKSTDEGDDGRPVAVDANKYVGQEA